MQIVASIVTLAREFFHAKQINSHIFNVKKHDQIIGPASRCPKNSEEETGVFFKIYRATRTSHLPVIQILHVSRFKTDEHTLLSRAHKKTRKINDRIFAIPDEFALLHVRRKSIRRAARARSEPSFVFSALPFYLLRITERVSIPRNSKYNSPRSPDSFS